MASSSEGSASVTGLVAVDLPSCHGAVRPAFLVAADPARKSNRRALRCCLLFLLALQVKSESSIRLPQSEAPSAFEISKAALYKTMSWLSKKGESIGGTRGNCLALMWDDCPLPPHLGW